MSIADQNTPLPPCHMERYSQTMRFYTVSMLVIIRSESCIWTILLGNTFSHSKSQTKTSAWKINVQSHDTVLLSAGVLHTPCPVMSSGAFFLKSAAKKQTTCCDITEWGVWRCGHVSAHGEQDSSYFLPCLIHWWCRDTSCLRAMLSQYM